MFDLHLTTPLLKLQRIARRLLEPLKCTLKRPEAAQDVKLLKWDMLQMFRDSMVSFQMKKNGWVGRSMKRLAHAFRNFGLVRSDFESYGRSPRSHVCSVRNILQGVRA